MNPNKLYNYQTKPTLVRFEDMPGFEMRMRPVPVGTLMDMFKQYDAMSGDDPSPEQAMELFELFARVLDSWNLAVDGEPVPPTSDGVRSLDPVLFRTLFTGWAEGLMGVPPPLQKPSADGPLPEGLGSLPMEPLSIVRAS